MHIVSLFLRVWGYFEQYHQIDLKLICVNSKSAQFWGDVKGEYPVIALVQVFGYSASLITY